MICHNASRSWCAFARLALVGSLAISYASESRAGGLIPINFDPNGPFVQTFDGSVTYVASTGDFNVQATLNYFVSSTAFASIDNSTATINLTLDQNGNLLGPGSIALNGGIDLDGDGMDDVTGTLLTGTVTAFGAAPAGPAPWEFDGLFTFTGGGLTQSSIPLSGGGTYTDLFAVGQTGGFDLAIESQTSGILGDFSTDFSGNSLKGVVAGVSVPEPSTATLQIIAMVSAAGTGLMCRRGRRKRYRSAE